MNEKTLLLCKTQKKSLNRAKKSANRKLKSKEKRKKRNRNKLGKSKERRQEENRLKGYTKIPAPDFFSLINHPEETINFIQKLEKLYINKKKVYVDLFNVSELDYSAISILVSVMFTFKSRNIGFNGSFPKNEDLRKMLIDSDFFKHLHQPIRNKLEYNIGKKIKFLLELIKKLILS